MGRLLAIDYGTKRVGLAVTDPLQMIATGLTTVHSSEVLAYLKDYLQKEQVDAFVVGKPLQMDGSDSESAVYVEKFLSLLAKNFPETPIFRADERFTSKMASRTMVEMGLKKKDRQNKENIDQLSAVIILQGYMETREWLG